MARRALALTLLALLALLAFAAPARAEVSPWEAPFELSKFGMSRLRKTISSSNVVTVEFAIQAGDADLRDLRATVEFVDYRGKGLGRGRSSKIGDLPAGKRTIASVTGSWVPIFNGYLISITGQVDGERGEWDFFGASNVDVPFFLPKKPYERTCQPVSMSHELEHASRGRGAKLYIRVRNLGDKRATGAKCKVQLIGKKGPTGKPVTVKLSGAPGGRNGIVDGGEERLFTIRFRNFPEFTGYSIDLAWDAPATEDLVAGGEFTGAAEVELGHFVFTKRDGGALEIVGRARNGLDRAVEDIKVKIHLLGKGGKKGRPKVVRTLTHVIRGVLASGKIVPFRFTAAKVGAYDNFEYEVAYGEPGARKKTPARAAPVALGQAAVKFTKAKPNAKGGVDMAGVVENVGASGIRNVRILVSFKRRIDGKLKIVATYRHVIERALRPGETDSFRFTAAPVGAIDEYFFEVSFDPAEKK